MYQKWKSNGQSWHIFKFMGLIKEYFHKKRRKFSVLSQRNHWLLAKITITISFICNLIQIFRYLIPFTQKTSSFKNLQMFGYRSFSQKRPLYCNTIRKVIYIAKSLLLLANSCDLHSYPVPQFDGYHSPYILYERCPQKIHKNVNDKSKLFIWW